MATIDRTRRAVLAVENELSNLWDVLADYENADGDAVITNGDTIDDLIEIIEILARIESRRIREIKSEYESIM